MEKTNVVGWFDIYVDNLNRATAFYEAVLKLKLETMGDPTSETQMMSFPSDMKTYGASGALVKSNYSKPGAGGTLIYFSTEDCTSEELRIVSAGGKVIRSKFSIGEFGWVTICQDTEGNLFGLSSMR
jgi:uncharacterized protein